MATSAGDIVILDNKSKEVFLPFGSALTFKCNLSTKGYQRFKVKWSFRPNTIVQDPKFKSVTLHTSEAFNASTNEEKKVLSYITKATVKDSGWYFCTIIGEVPEYHLNTTKETHVIISKYFELNNLVKS